MIDWRNISVKGLRVSHRVVGIFEVYDTECRLPERLIIKVIERPNGSFLAVTNFAVRGPTGEAEWTSGLGKTIDEALEDCLGWFHKTFEDRTEVQLSEIVYAINF